MCITVPFSRNEAPGPQYATLGRHGGLTTDKRPAKPLPQSRRIALQELDATAPASVQHEWEGAAAAPSTEP